MSFRVREGSGGPPQGTVGRSGATCLACGSPIPFEHVRAEGRRQKLDQQLVAIVTDQGGKRVYHSATHEHASAARLQRPEDAPDNDLPLQALGFRLQAYGMTTYADMFTNRQLWTLGAFADLVRDVPGWAEEDGATSEYADLADYFYIWLRRALKEVHPDLFSTLLTPKSDELIASAYRHGGDTQAARDHFVRGFAETFASLAQASRPDLPMLVVYAHRQEETTPGGNASTAWDAMLEAMLSAGLGVVGTWPLRGTREARMISVGTNALASYIVLVCRPRLASAVHTDRRSFLKALRAELPDAVRDLQRGNVAPVDLAQASIGPGMAVFSRYAKVVEADGSGMTVRTALGLINQSLDEILAEQEGDSDAETRFAVMWFEQRGTLEGPYGEADVLARAKNTSVAGLEEAGILASRAGRVRLLNREEMLDEWDPVVDKRPTVWEAAQHLTHRLELEGEEAAAGLLRKIGGDYGEKARELAYRLYRVCERKGWTQDAISYNALGVAWTEIARRVAGTPEAQAQEALEV